MTKDSKKLAPIIVLLGTSSSGKSTICNEFVAQGENRKYVDIDAIGAEIKEGLRNKCAGLIGKDERFQKLQGQLSDNAIYDIVTSAFMAPIKGKEPIFLRHIYQIPEHGKDPKKFHEEIFPKIAEKFAKENGISQESLLLLKGLVDDYRSKLREGVPDQSEEGYKKAIENSKSGVATIIDLVGQNQVEALEKMAKENGCQVQVVLMHLPIRVIEQRLDERNKEAEKNGDKDNARSANNAQRQYDRLFGIDDDGFYIPRVPHNALLMLKGNELAADIAKDIAGKALAVDKPSTSVKPDQIEKLSQQDSKDIHH